MHHGTLAFRQCCSVGRTESKPARRQKSKPAAAGKGFIALRQGVFRDVELPADPPPADEPRGGPASVDEPLVDADESLVDAPLEDEDEPPVDEDEPLADAPPGGLAAASRGSQPDHPSPIRVAN